MPAFRFERFEYKYFVPERRVDEIRAFIAPYVLPDADAGERIDGSYTITNLYYDTPTFELWHQQEVGAMDRYKLRIRTYGTEADGPIFFEVKRKVKDVVVKTRGFCPRDDYADRVQWIFADQLASESDWNLADFQRRALIHGAVPQVLLRYEREAYESRFGDYARVTFDRGIRFQPARGTGLTGECGAWNYLDTGLDVAGFPSAVLVELKFTRHVPYWLYDLVRTFQLEQTNSSKYHTCIQHQFESVRRGLPGVWRANRFI